MMIIEPTILYVEDDANSREVLHLMMLESGLNHVTIFEDSSDFDARVKALNPAPDLFLLDIHIQPHDGFAMLTMLRAQTAFQTTPVVALTASVMNEEVQRLKQAGFNGVIPKPIDQDNFLDLVRRFLRGEQSWRVIS